jgi:hypothetical protein
MLPVVLGAATTMSSLSGLASPTGFIVIRVNVRKKIRLSPFATSLSFQSPGSIRISHA